MSALAVEVDAYVLPADTRALMALARSFGPLRSVTPEQAPVIRAASDHDRTVLPKWQRHGVGIHEWAEPRHYTRGRTWVRGAVTRVKGPRGWGYRVDRVETYTDSPHVNWRTRDHWLVEVITEAVQLRPEALHTNRGNVSKKQFLTYCGQLSKHANPSTGRRCIVRPDRLAEELSVSKSTVQRCQEAAETLGLYVVMSPGRMLGDDDTYRARQQGSRQRGMSNEAALVIPSWLPLEGVAKPLPTPSQNSSDTPTCGRYSKLENLQIRGSLRQPERSAGIAEPPPAARHRRKERHLSSVEAPQEPRNPPRRTSGRVYDPQALDLARGLAAALPWLRDTRPGRMEPALRRFVTCRRPWTPRDVVTAIDVVNVRLSQASMTFDLVKNPPALLASYLRDLDPDADHPRAWMDVESFSRQSVSPTRARNRVTLETHSGPVADPTSQAAAVDRIRDDLAARRAARKPNTQ